MLKKNKQILIILIVIAFLIITITGSYSFFNYAKPGSTESTIELGSITFKYTENENLGNGISIIDAFPISDEEGKNQTGEGKVFDFKVEANLSRSDIEYEVVARPTKDSTLPLDAIKLYLTDITSGDEEEITSSINEEGKVKTLDEYNDTLIENVKGKTIYEETILRNTKGYLKQFRARMWIAENVDWSDDKYINKSGAIKINVYANSERNMASNDTVNSEDVSIERVTANNKYKFTEVENKDYQYTLTVPYEVDEIDINVIPSNINSEVVITPVSRMLGLQIKENYFKVLVTSSDKTKTKEYLLQVIREVDTDNSLFSLKVDGYSLSPIFDPEIKEYTLTTETNKIEILAEATSGLSSVTGTGIKELEWGENPFEIIVTSQDGMMRTYKITVNNERPTAPVLTGGSNDWVSNPLTISIQTEGQTISGIKYYEYYISNESDEPTDTTKATGTTSNNLTINEEGTTYIWYRTVSNNEFRSKWSDPQVVKYDITAPTITNILNDSNNNWVNHDVIISFDANDTGGAGIAKTVYSYNKTNELNDFDTSPTATSVKGTWFAERNQEVFVRTYDAAGNVSDWYSVGYVRIDTTKPTITNIVNDSNSNWVSRDVTITFDVNDTGGSKIAKTVYSYDKNNEQTNFATEPTATNVKGTWYSEREKEIFIRTYDTAGNVSDWYSAGYVRIDRTAPTVIVSASGKTTRFIIKDNTGAVAYGVNQTTDTQPTWTTFNSTTSTSKIWTAQNIGNYVVWVKDAAQMITTQNFSITTAYYKFGVPTTASSTDFLSVINGSSTNTFVQLQGEQYSVCIYRNQTLDCFKNNNYEEERLHLISVFGEDKCNDKVSNIACTADDNFGCGMNSEGYVNCNDSLNNRCDVYPSDYITCIRQ